MRRCALLSAAASALALTADCPEPLDVVQCGTLTAKRVVGESGPRDRRVTGPVARWIHHDGEVGSDNRTDTDLPRTRPCRCRTNSGPLSRTLTRP